MSCTSSLSSSSQSFSFCLQETIEKRIRWIQVDSHQCELCLQLHYMSARLSVCHSICLYVCLSVCILDSLSVCLSFCLPICLFVSLSLFLSARLSVCSSIRPFVCPSVYLVYFQLQPLGLCRKLARPASPAEQNAWVAWEWKLEIISRAPCCCIAQMFLNRAT